MRHLLRRLVPRVLSLALSAVAAACVGAELQNSSVGAGDADASGLGGRDSDRDRGGDAAEPGDAGGDDSHQEVDASDLRDEEEETPDVGPGDGGRPDGNSDPSDPRDGADLPNAAPVAEVESALSGLVGGVIGFDGSGSSDPDGIITRYAWEFGDGGVGFGPFVEHMYRSPGAFNGMLTVTDNEGATGVAEFTVNVTAVSVDGPTAIIEFSDPIGLAGQIAHIDGNGSIPGDSRILSWQWEISGPGFAPPYADDGDAIDVLFPAYGNFDVSLTVLDEAGLSDVATVGYRVGVGPAASITTTPAPWSAGVPIGFDGGASSDLDGTVVDWHWDFGDGATAEGESVEHAFAGTGSWRVVLTVTDDDGIEGSSETEIFVTSGNQSPVADAGPDQSSVPGVSVHFDGSASVDPDGAIATWDWDFGDGTTGSGPAIDHIFAFPATYTVTLTVTDDRGAIGVDTATVGIGSANAAPIANAGPDRSATIGEPVAFDGTGSSDSDGAISAWLWDFGDGTTASGPTVAHSWSGEGAFVATLTVTDDQGAVATDTAAVAVSRSSQPPIARLSWNPIMPGEGESVSLDGTTSSDPDSDPIVGYRWSFGDGSPDQYGATTSHAWTSEGTYSVRLEVTDSRGLTGSTTSTITVTCVTDCYGGTFRVRAFDSEEPQSAGCNTYISITVVPFTCNTTVAGGSITMNCEGVTYRGSMSGPSFTVYRDPYYFDTMCGAASFVETISGTYVSSDRWEGTSSLGLNVSWEDGWDCYDCYFEPFPMTGTRL